MTNNKTGRLSEFRDRVLSECESTNDFARKLADDGAPHGSWISARKQNSGRGRLGRRWESLEGNLFLSIVTRISKKPPLNQSAQSPAISWIPIVSALAIAEFLRGLHPELRVEVKWPNDLWLNQCKLGGLLCEASSNETETCVIIGIGLNCAQAPQGLDQQAVSLSDFLNEPITADEVRAPIVKAVLKVVERLLERGSEEFRQSYEYLAAFKAGQEVEWGDGSKNSFGTVLGLGPSGELRVNAQDQELSLFAEDVKIRRRKQADR